MVVNCWGKYSGFFRIVWENKWGWLILEEKMTGRVRERSVNQPIRLRILGASTSVAGFSNTGGPENCYVGAM